MKFWLIVLLIINFIIGIGIFLLFGVVVKLVGDKVVIIYLVVVVFVVVLVVIFVVVLKYVVKLGVVYVYLKVVFGDEVGFYVGIIRVVLVSIVWGVMVIGVVKIILFIFG